MAMRVLVMLKLGEEGVLVYWSTDMALRFTLRAFVLGRVVSKGFAWAA